MGRGIFFGAFWGLVVGATVLAVSSLLSDVPPPRQSQGPETEVVEVPAGSQFDQAGVDEAVAAPVPDAAVDAQSDAPLVTAPQAPPAPALPGDVTTSAAVPETGGATPLGAPPEAPADSGVELRAEVAPDAAANDANVETALIEAPLDEAAPASDAPAPAIADAPGAAVPEGEDAANEAAGAAPATQTAQTARPPVAAGGFGDRADGVTVNRGDVDDEPASATPTIAAGAAPDPNDTRPISVFSARADWPGPDDRPLFSIGVIDEAGDAALLGALGSFQGPLTFAIPGDAPQAAEAMAAYRAAGYEVALLADLPEGAQASDVEQAMAGYLETVPEAVAILDGTFSGFRGNRRIAEQISEILVETGHGLLTFDQGLNTAAQLADRAGVPTGVVFRDLDDRGQGNTVIRRFLDQAAFRAGQDGQAILLARLRPETISALLIWHQQERASRVNLAPLSAVLLAGAAP
ncbi:MAG: divergent polysaccharide deacetylase family protein [Pseudomonadota bacterium]